MRSSLVRQVLILAALALAPGLGEAVYFRHKISWQSSIPPSELVTVDQARAWGDGAIWVDARLDDEFARDHVPGALSLNEDRWNELLPQVLLNWSPDRKIIVYCSAESCNAARDVAKRLRDETHIQNIVVLQGGWEAWVKKNR